MDASFLVILYNLADKIKQLDDHVPAIAPLLPRSSDPREYMEDLYLPNFVIDSDYVLADDNSSSAPAHRDVYTASTTVRQRVVKSDTVIVSSSRTIIDDVLLWSNSRSVVLLLFKCILQVLCKNRF